MSMGYRRRILEALVDTGSCPSQITADAGSKGCSRNVQAAICALRKRGFVVSTFPGQGYRMEPAERERLKNSDWFKRAIRHGESDAPAPIFVVIPRETINILRAEAEERGVPFDALAARAMELGVSELLEEPQ